MTKDSAVKVLVGSAVILVLAAALVSCSALGGMGQYDAIVEATGEHTADCERPDLPGVMVTQDVCNVQQAVNENPGGKILLRGTFHFAEIGEDGFVVPGTDGTVFIANDIEISGERDGDEYLTTILGGYNTFLVGYEPIEWAFDFSLDEEAIFPENARFVPVKATIQNINFENSLFTPLRVWATTGITIEGNQVYGGRSLEWWEMPIGWGIGVSPPGWRDYPEVISGNIHIVRNYIDGRYRNVEAGDPWGVNESFPVRGLGGSSILVAQADGEVLIEANQVHNMQWGIDARCNNATTQILENTIHLPTREPEPLWRYWGIAFSHDCDHEPNEDAQVTIANNDVSVGGVNGGTGIAFGGAMGKPKISENKVNLLTAEGSAGIDFWRGSNGQIEGNEFVGSGDYAIILGDPEPEEEMYQIDSNIVRDNIMDEFAALEVECVLGEGVTNNTVYVDAFANALDQSGNDTNTIIQNE